MTLLRLSLALSLLLAGPARAVEGNLVLATRKIHDGVLGNVIQNGSAAGLDVESLGDVNGDGHPDIAFGAWLDESSGTDRGAIHLVFLDAAGNPLTPSTIEFADGVNDPPNELNLEDLDQFGSGLEFLGDFDADGKLEFAVGAINADPGSAPSNSGAVHLLEIDPTTWKITDDVVIASGTANFTTLDANDALGFSIADLGDWDGDGGPEIAVSATNDDDGGVTDSGALYILYLKPDGTGVKTYMKLSDTQGSFDGVLDTDASSFGRATGIGDLDGDGQVDLAVGAPAQGAAGAVWIVFMDPACQDDTTVVPHPTCTAKSGAVKIAPGSNGFTGPLGANANFGVMLAWLPDGVPQLAVGAHIANGARGEVWLLRLTASGTVAGQARIGSQQNWNVTLDANDTFGVAVDAFPDRNADGVSDLMVGARFDDEPTTDTGAVYLLTLDPCKTVITTPSVFHAPNDDGVDACIPIQDDDGWHLLHLYLKTGAAVSSNPLDVCRSDLATGDEMCAFDVRIAVEPPYEIWSFAPASGAYATNGSPYPPNELRVNWIDTGAPTNPGAGPIKLGDLLVVAAAPGGAVRVAPSSVAVGAALELHGIGQKTILVPEPERWMGIAASLAALGLLGRWRAWRSGRGRGRAGLLLLAALLPGLPARAEISVQQTIQITAFGDSFGSGVASIGDFDRDGTPDLAVGSETWNVDRGRIALLFLTENGGVAGSSTINGAYADQYFGSSIANLGDLDGDGVIDLAVGGMEAAFPGWRGSLTVLFLNANGTEKSRVLHDETNPLLSGLTTLGSKFWASVARLGDLDSNGTLEIAVGAPWANAGQSVQPGEIWLLSLNPNGSLAAATRWSKVGGLPSGIPIQDTDYFGSSVTALGDLDGSGSHEFALAVGSPGDHDGGGNRGSFYILYLDVQGPGQISVTSYVKHSSATGSLPFALQNEDMMGNGMAFEPAPAGGPGGILYVWSGRFGSQNGNDEVWPLRLAPDGSISRGYVMSAASGVGLPAPTTCGSYQTDDLFGRSIAVLPDFDGDEVADLAVGASGACATPGRLFVLRMKDTDFDGLDDNLDNCLDVHDPSQADEDDDGDGDVCDNCRHLANPSQSDADTDGEGDLCEPVEVLLETTGSPSNPTWNVWLECGAYSVTDLAGAIVLPAGSTADLDCPGNALGCLALSGATVGASVISGPGLSTPGGVRSDTLYFEASGNGSPDNRLCTALDDPALLGTLQAGPIAGTQLAAAALTLEGVGTPGFGNDPAEDGSGPVPVTDLRLVNAAPLPKLDLELGPAVETDDGTRWEICVPRADHEFHRVAFWLIAPAGTDASDMRWVGCDTTPNGSGQRSCTGGLGFGATVSPAGSFTVGPQASPPGTQLPHTLYVVLEGSRFSSFDQDTLNFVGEGVCLGAVELDSSPDLEPALTADGLETLGVTPFELADSGEDPIDPGEVKLIGKFNPADDVDGDNVQDLGDNCPFAANTAQTNRGSFDSDVDESDALGDACQCGESSDDGAVLDPSDFDDLRAYLSGQITNPIIAAQIESRCSVVHDTSCNMLDLVHLRLALDGVLTGVETRCDAALAPPAP